eukprot:897771-Pyramimonas_sp.AAC.1
MAGEGGRAGGGRAAVTDGCRDRVRLCRCGIRAVYWTNRPRALMVQRRARRAERAARCCGRVTTYGRRSRAAGALADFGCERGVRPANDARAEVAAPDSIASAE